MYFLLISQYLSSQLLLSKAIIFFYTKSCINIIQQMIKGSPQVIFRDQIYSLQAWCTAESLKLRLNVEGRVDQPPISEKDIFSMNQLGFLYKYCGNLEQFFELIKNIHEQAIIQMKIEGCSIKFTQMHIIKKQTAVNQVKIDFEPLGQKVIVNCVEIVSKLYQKCHSKDQIGSGEAKSIFFMVATVLEQLIKSNDRLQRRILVSQKEKNLKIKKFQEEIQKLHVQVEELKRQHKIFNGQAQKESRPIADERKDYKQTLQNEIKQPQTNIIQQNQKKEKAILSDIQAQNWVDSECRHIKKMIFSENKISAKQDLFIFGKKHLTEQSSFTVSFSKLGGWADIGIIDSQERSKSDLGPNCIWYYNNGNCFVGGKAFGKSRDGFKTGQSVTVTVNFTESSIQFRVGQDVRFQTKTAIINDPNITWVPFVWLGSSGDCVSIIE